MAESAELFTIGHSNHSLDRFMELLQEHEITAICDVRATPYSRYNPQFNREHIKEELKKRNIVYVFMGRELGPKSENPRCYSRGQVQYDTLAEEPLFKKGLARLKDGMRKFRLALMCSEQEPITCHRTILICRNLRAPGMMIQHILGDGGLETHQDTEKRLMKLFKLEPDMFYTEEQCIERAYVRQAAQTAYIKT